LGIAWSELKEYAVSNGFDNVSRVDVLTISEGRSKGCGIVDLLPLTMQKGLYWKLRMLVKT
jgi:hypothetical protein